MSGGRVPPPGTAVLVRAGLRRAEAGLEHGQAAVGLGEAVVGAAGAELVAFGLGSCIGLALWSPRMRLGALCHIVLPGPGGESADPAAPARYAGGAVAWAVGALLGRGARREELVAKLAGGAQVLAVQVAAEIGRQNAAATLAELEAHGVRVAGRSTGGRQGRTVRFHPATGIMEIRPVGGDPLRI